VKQTSAYVGILVVLVILSIDATAAMRAHPVQAKGTTPAASTAAGGDACSLFKKEDAAAVLGGTVSGPKSVGPRSDGAGSTVSGCGYSGSGLQSVQVNLTRLPANQVAIYKGTCAGKGGDGLSGLGEVACWYDNKHEELHVFKGTAFVSVELRGKSNPTETIKAIAKKVIDQVK
jgi:hypothetical protein